MLASDLAMSVTHSGHMYAMALAASSLSPSAHLSEQFAGLSQSLFLLTGLSLQVCRKYNSSRSGGVENALEGFCDSLPSSRYEESSHVKNPDYQTRGVKTHYEMPFPVNYISRCLPTVPYTHEDFPSGEKAVAYGSGAKAGGGILETPSSLTEIPNFEGTLSAFEDFHSVGSGRKVYRSRHRGS
ncbi:Presequence protease, mitochondrial [Desmophyllum pertusum]|uniref:Presequence protease, mitochondrial n=1 Tax=Desmophyllum pertusum TaxID=174260 RepID=A0A9X0D5L8_9CNID|nr:Presequence protease, mitochondrial [Desmophyllum pertusum]